MKNVRLLRFILLMLLAVVLIACNTVEPAAAPAEDAAEAETENTEETAAEEVTEIGSDIPADWPEVFNMGVFAGDDAEAALKGFEPLRLYLEDQLGIPVEGTTGTSYSAVIEAMKSGRVDAMQVGPFSFVLAEQEAGAIPIATIVDESRELTAFSADQFPYYFSVFVTKKGSGIDTLDDLEGVDLAFVDPASTSGRNAPVVRLINEIDGLETPADVDSWLNPIFAGSHPSAITALANDQVIAAVTYEGNMLTVAEEGVAEICGFEDGKVGVQLTQDEIDATYEACPDGNLVVIAQSDPIPNTPFAISPDLPESFREAVRKALLSTADDSDFITEYGSYYVAPEEILSTVSTTSSFYDVVRDIARVTIDEEASPAVVDKSEWPEVFNMGVFAGDDAEAALKGFEPLRLYLEDALGIPVEGTTGTSYSAVIEAMKSGRVDAMQVGPFSFVLAEQEAGAIPIATIVDESRELTAFSADQFPYYFSVFVTKKGSGIDTLDDLEGVDLAFVDPASTSGRNAPVVRLINEIDGLETPADVDSWLNPIFAGSHPSAITALANDQVVAAVTYEGNMLNVAEEGVAEICGFEDGKVGVQLTQDEIDAIYEACPEGNLVIIAQSDPIPNTPFAISPDLPESFREAVRDALLSTASDPDFITEYGSYYVAPESILSTINTTSDFYDVVRDIAAITIEE